MSKVMQIKYFMFSVQQLNLRKDVEKQLGRTYRPGVVLVNGEYKQYTEILNDPKKSRFSDATVVASGILDEMIYRK